MKMFYVAEVCSSAAALFGRMQGRKLLLSVGNIASDFNIIL
jgi:hypothetical protein